VSGVLKKEKQRLSSIIDDLEALAEISPLSPQQIEIKNQSNVKIACLLHEEEIKWYQRSKSKFILEGDSNTRYFHSVANGSHRKKRIHSLARDEGMIEGLDNLKSYITNYYKNLFRAPEEGNFSLDETRTEDIPQVYTEENDLLQPSIWKKRLERQFSKWNTIKHRDPMVSQLSFTKLFGILSKGIYLNCSAFFMLDN
jgi:hypothetical protein